MKKLILILLLSSQLSACDSEIFQEFVFRKTLESELIDLCGKKDKKCIKAVKAQIKGCMVKSDWLKFVNDQDDEKLFDQFINKFYSCIVDSKGNPYFEPK